MYKNIGILGNTGGTGSILTNEIINAGLFNVYLINAQAKDNPEKLSLQNEWEKKGARVLDMTAPDFIEKLSKVDVVLSVISGEVLESLQRKMIDECKKAGVKLFIPSEFGADIEFTMKLPRRNSVFERKARVRDYIRETGIPYLIFLSGLFEDFFVSPFFGIDLAKKRLEQYGDLDRKIAFIHRRDIGKYLVYFFAHPEILPKDSTQIHLATEFLNQRELRILLEKKAPNLQVTHHSIEEMKKIIEEDQYGWRTFAAQIFMLISLGIWDQGSKFPESPPKFQEAVPRPITLESYLQNL